MTRKQYAVDTVRDEPVRLRDQLDHIAAEGGRVVSVIWQPARQVTLEPGSRHTKSHRATSLFPSMSCLTQRATEGRLAALHARRQRPGVLDACGREVHSEIKGDLKITAGTSGPHCDSRVRRYLIVCSGHLVA